MRFAFAIRVGDELSRLMEHLLVPLDELWQKLTEIILREAYNQECSNDNINGDTIRAVERDEVADYEQNYDWNNHPLDYDLVYYTDFCHFEEA
jgi:hypothetical protein